MNLVIIQYILYVLGSHYSPPFLCRIRHTYTPTIFHHCNFISHTNKVGVENVRGYSGIIALECKSTVIFGTG